VQNNRLQAVHDDDLASLLTSLGLHDKVNAGQCLCQFCKKVISMENLGAIIPLNGEITFSCDTLICINSMIELGDTNDRK